MYRLALVLLSFIGSSKNSLGNTELDPSFPSQGNLEQLVHRNDVEIYQGTKALEFVGGKRVRCFVCMNSLSVMVVTEAWKNAYPASFRIVLTGRKPKSGMYQFQEVEIDKLVAVGLDVDLLSKIQRSSLTAGMGATIDVGPLLLVTIKPDKIKEFESIMLRIPTKKPSELAEMPRLK